MRTDVKIEWLTRKHIPKVLQIEGESFNKAWSEDDFLTCLRQRNCIGMVAECQMFGPPTLPMEEEICAAMSRKYGSYSLSEHEAIHGKQRLLKIREDTTQELMEKSLWQMVGFVVYELHKSRLHILNMAVGQLFRRQAVGSQIIECLIEKLEVQRRTEILLEVREGNLPAHLFFRRLGFKAIATLRGHYDDTDEDAYLMKYQLKGTQGEPTPFAPANRISAYTEA